MFAIPDQAVFSSVRRSDFAEDYKEDVNNSIRFCKVIPKSLIKSSLPKWSKQRLSLNLKKLFYRDRLSLLREVQAQQAVFKVKGEADILAIAYQAGVTCVQIMYVRNGRMLGGKSYFPDMLGDDLGQMLSDFMANFYFQVADEVPNELIVNIALPDCKNYKKRWHSNLAKGSD